MEIYVPYRKNTYVQEQDVIYTHKTKYTYTTHAYTNTQTPHAYTRTRAHSQIHTYTDTRMEWRCIKYSVQLLETLSRIPTRSHTYKTHIN